MLIRSVVFCCVTGALCLPGLPGCPCAKPVSPQASPQLSRSSSRFSNSSRRSAGKGPYLSVQRGVDSTASPYECSCCCCNEDLIKIQVGGLLFGASLAYFSIECRLNKTVVITAKVNSLEPMRNHSITGCKKRVVSHELQTIAQVTE